VWVGQNSVRNADDPSQELDAAGSQPHDRAKVPYQVGLVRVAQFRRGCCPIHLAVAIELLHR
jgi:hypothetical protein